ncbi:MAG: NAD(P)-binding domain-containing protein, partial [Gemmataceae bacterium]|nr:NAD(P)-binding domain-containing protein [Gemmataceae bacterium]
MSDRRSVAVLGAGHGGMALAAYLSLRGNDVVLWNRSPDPVEEVAVRGGITLSVGNAPARFAPVAGATTDLGAALDFADLVVVALPALAHGELARKCAPRLRPG